MWIPVTPTLIVLYIVLAAIASLPGRERRLGFWGMFVLSLLVTPIVATALFVLFTPVDRRPL